MLEKHSRSLKMKKAFVTTVFRNVEGYWSPGDDDNMTTGRNICLMARQTIECDEGYWSLGSEGEDEENVVEPNYCYIATNDPPGRNIVQ